ncbi:tRNA preQ1(34) S-adenosylmethionine ribosyltransferase-isomerase QueA [Candidatus Margulisiibacteriota bacterium]
MLKTSDFDYKFPQELIAHEPLSMRDHSRMMVLHRRSHILDHKRFHNIIDYLQPGDLLVLNDTQVIPANLSGVKADGGAKVEVLLAAKRPAPFPGQEVWLCLVRPGKRLKVGSEIVFGNGELRGRVLRKMATGEQLIEFEAQGDFWGQVYKLGEVPLPPYIKPQNAHSRAARAVIRDRYQTVYADAPGASAAPTAGLHFTRELLEKLIAKGVRITYLTLHTGLATFRPVWADNVLDHEMHTEFFDISQETVDEVVRARRVIAVGTTSVRALETMAHRGITSGSTNLFIYPGFKFKVVNGLITNFHWPRSTLIMLVSAFAGKDFVMEAYQEAIKEKYRFFSFGDAMFIL